MEYESFIHLHTAHDIYQLDGHVPKTVVSGKTTNIGPFCEFCFWDWVKFRGNGIAFPSDDLILGKYMGPSIVLGLAMTSQIMKANGKFEDCSTVRALTSEESINATLFQEQQAFCGGALGS